MKKTLKIILKIGLIGVLLFFTLFFILPNVYPFVPTEKEIKIMVKDELCLLKFSKEDAANKEQIKKDLQNYKITFYFRKAPSLGKAYFLYNLELDSKKGMLSYRTS